MRCIAGDECGVIKEYVSARKSGKDDGAAAGGVASLKRSIEVDGIRRINTSDEMTRSNGVVALNWIDYIDNSGDAMVNDGMTRSFASLHVNGSVQTWRGSYDNDKQPHGSYSQTSFITVFDADEDALGMGRLQSTSSLVACSNRGTVVVFDPLVDSEATGNDDDDERNAAAIKSSFSAISKPSNDTISSSVVPPISTFACHTSSSWVAMGGKDRDMLLFDLQHQTAAGNSSPTPMWKAKNVAPDPQTLLQPQVWPTAALFWTQSDDSQSSNLLVVGSAYRQIRIYDLRMNGSTPAGTMSLSNGSKTPLVQRRPMVYTSLDEQDRIVDHRVTALCALDSYYELAVGDAGGDIMALDVRALSGGAILRTQKSPIVRRFVGPAGSVRQLAHCPVSHRLVAVSLDRMLRMYDTNPRRPTSTRQPLHTVYLKQRQNCVLVAPEPDQDDEEHEDDGDIDQEDVTEDYVDSDHESLQDEDDVLEEMIDALDDDEDEENEDDDNDESEASDEEPEDATQHRKRRRQ